MTEKIDAHHHLRAYMPEEAGWIDWREDIFGVGATRNVSKLSGLVSETDWTSWSEDDLRMYVNAVLAAFGPPVVPNGAHLINSLSATEKMPHLGGTAIDVYRLDD